MQALVMALQTGMITVQGSNVSGMARTPLKPEDKQDGRMFKVKGAKLNAICDHDQEGPNKLAAIPSKPDSLRHGPFRTN